MIEKINSEELKLMHCFHYPISFMEAMFGDIDNLAECGKELSEIRFYQMPMLSYGPFIDTKMPGLNKKEQFMLEKGCSDCYNFSGRKIGKTVVEKIDIPYSMVHDANYKTALTAPDGVHLSEVLDDVKNMLESHPILSEWCDGSKGAPTYQFKAKNGWRLKGINMKLKSKSPGSHWYGLHVKKIWGEEMSFETREVYEKRKEAVSEFSAIFRLSGMTNFTRQMPIGEEYYNPKNRNKIVNLPQMVSKFWDAEEKKDRIDFYGGISAPNFKIFVLGEVLEDGVSEFDIERVSNCLNQKRKIKRFEIRKEQINHFKDLLVVERPKNSDRIFIAADIGDGAGGSDIGVFSEVGDTYRLLYNIILYNVTENEQFELLMWLIQELQSNVVALDCGEACGRGLYDSIIKKDPEFINNLVWYSGNKKVVVGYEQDEKGNYKMKGGKPIEREEFMSEWSVRRLKTLLYNERMDIPKDDHKFIDQINSVISIRTSGTRVRYACPSRTGDHYFDMFKIFSIAQWLKADFNSTPEMSTNWGIGING